MPACARRHLGAVRPTIASEVTLPPSYSPYGLNLRVKAYLALSGGILVAPLLVVRIALPRDETDKDDHDDLLHAVVDSR